MQNAIQFFDECFGAPQGHFRKRGPVISLASETMRAEEIIRARVAAEWELRGGGLSGDFADGTALLAWLWDGAHLHCKTCEAATEAALSAFTRRDFLFFWNDEQIDKLGHRVLLRDKNDALFLKIIPLQGG